MLDKQHTLVYNKLRRSNKAAAKEEITELIRTDIIRGKMAEKGYTQIALAEILGITPKSFQNKMRKGVFKSNEMEKMISVLEIENPVAVFFCQKSNEHAT